MKDWRGNEYDVGDTIVYGRDVGHACVMVEAKVLEFSEVKQGWNKGKPVVVVQPTAESRYSWRFRDTVRPVRPAKPVRLTTLKNITKVSDGNSG